MITNYTELKASIAAWGKRNDLTAVIPDFITLAEKRIKKAVNMRSMEVEASLASVPSSALIAMPTDFQVAIALFDNSTDTREKLVQLRPVDLPVSDSNGIPVYWAVDNTNIRFDVNAEAVRAYTLRYEQKFELSDANPTNYLLTEYPSVYLFGAMLELSNYVVDDQRSALWQQRFAAELEILQYHESKRNAGAMLRTEVQSSARFDINRGY